MSHAEATSTDGIFNPASLVLPFYLPSGLVFNIPAGQLIAGLGIRRVIIVSTFIEGLFALGASLAPSPWFLGLMAFGIGMTQTTFFVARLSYFKTFVPTHHRGPWP